MKEVLTAEGHRVPILRADSVPPDFSLSPYDGVIIGGSRMLLKVISRRSGRPTDTSRDHELTNWDQVTRFADEFAASLPEPAAVVCARP